MSDSAEAQPLRARLAGGGTPKMEGRWYLKSETGVLRDVLLGPAESFRWLNSENAAWSSLVRDTLRKGYHFDKQLAMRQHREMVDAYESAGVACHYLPLSDEVPYQIYARDSSFMTPYGAVICQLANPRRRGEYAPALRFYLEAGIPIYDMVSAGNFEGGDFNIIRPGMALVGYTDHRSEEVAAKQVAAWFLKEGWEVKFAPIDQFYVHIDLMVCMLNDRCAAVCLETTEDDIVDWLKSKRIEIIPASFKETMALGCNVVALGRDRVLSTLGARELNGRLRAAGFEVLDPDMTMFTWAGGGVHCMCQPLRREAAWMRRAEAIVAMLVAVLAMAFLAAAPVAATPDERVALVIGNADYRAASTLKNPRNDAEAMTAALERLGFRVIKGVDLSGDALKSAVRDFSRALETAKVALFFYAGHGMQVNGRNFLIPVDAKLGSEADLDFEAMDVKFVLRQMERANRTNIVLLDACLNNPLAATLARSMGERGVFLGRGLARIESGVGTIIAFATQPDNVASDGEGQHSPFTAALLKNLETPGLDVELLLRRVRQDVIAATDGRQVPWTNSSLVGDRIVLRQPPEAETPAVDQPAAPAATSDPKRGANERDLELAYWASVRDSKNPALLKAYLEKFPEGAFANLARVIVDDLEGGSQAPPPKEAIVTPEPAEPPAAPAPSPAVKPPSAPEQDEANLPPPKQVEPVPPRPQRVVPKLKRPPRPETVIIKPPKREKPKPRLRREVTERPVSRPRPGPPVNAKQCGRCKTCEAMSNACKARWICGRFYLEYKASGFCSS